MIGKKKEAKPFDYISCFLADSSPPGIVEEVSEGCLASEPCIAFEFQDIRKAIEEGIAHAEKEKIPYSLSVEGFSKLASLKSGLGVTRMFLSLKSARALCCHLIHALSNTDDRIAKRLEEVLQESLEEYGWENSDERA